VVSILKFPILLELLTEIYIIGVGSSTPSVSVFQSTEESISWFAQEPSDVNSTPEALPEEWARYQAFGLAAEAHDNGVLNYVNTGLVARDMLGIVEALGQEKLQFLGYSCVKEDDLKLSD